MRLEPLLIYGLGTIAWIFLIVIFGVPILENVLVISAPHVLQIAKQIVVRN